MTEELCLLTRLRKWHAANLPEVDSAYDPMNIQDMIPEVIDRIEDLESALREAVNDNEGDLDFVIWKLRNALHRTRK